MLIAKFCEFYKHVFIYNIAVESDKAFQTINIYFFVLEQWVEIGTTVADGYVGK